MRRSGTSRRGDLIVPLVVVAVGVIASAGAALQVSHLASFAGSGAQLAYFVVLGGLLATLFVAAVAWSQAKARGEADIAAAAARDSARELELLYGASARLSAELDLDRLVQTVTDAGREISKAEIGAFFYNTIDEAGEAYQPFVVSGAPLEHFARMGKPRATDVFRPTFEGAGPLRADDITLDPRFGHNPPVNGFPKGHWPVKSYLAVPVISRSGEVLGGLFFGHPGVGVFTEQSERSMVALASAAAIAIDNARLFKASQDEIAARKRIEEHQKLLLDELNHRVKNTLATVQSIAAQTLRSSPEPAAFRDAFEDRLVALSEAHNLLSSGNWRGVTLRDLIERELKPHGLQDGRIRVGGDPISLPPAAAVALGMAMHELATNAARHGALSTPQGRVDLDWTVSNAAGGQRLRLTWKETGGPPVSEPARRGFGTRMIERGLKHDLQGEAKLHFDPDGLRCEIDAEIAPARQAA